MKAWLANLFETKPIAWMWAVHGATFVALAVLVTVPLLGPIASIAWIVELVVVSRKALRQDRLVNPEKRMLKLQRRLEEREAKLQQLSAKRAAKEKSRSARAAVSIAPAASRPSPSRRVVAVQVRFREFARGPLDDEAFAQPGGYYTYKWTLPTIPNVGDWVLIENQYGTQSAVICALGAGAEAGRYELKPVKSHVPAAEYELMALGWLDVAAQKAGIIDSTSSTSPRHFPRIPPIKGSADAEKADERGDVWWTLYRLAKQYSRPKAEIEAYRTIAKHWYAVRDSA